MRKKNKLYTANKYNLPLFADVDRESQNIYDGTLGSSTLETPTSNTTWNGWASEPSPYDNEWTAGLGKLGFNVGKPKYIKAGTGPLINPVETEEPQDYLNKKTPGKKNKMKVGAVGQAAIGLLGTEADPTQFLLDTEYGKMQTKAGGVLDTAGNSLIQAGAVSGNPYVLGAGILAKGVGFGINKTIGHVTNKAGVASIQRNISDLRNRANDLAMANTTSDFLDKYRNTDIGYDFSDRFVGIDGAWTHKERNRANALRANRKGALASFRRGTALGFKNVSNTQSDLADANYLYALGGPMNNLGNMGAIEYGLMSDYLTNYKNKSLGDTAKMNNYFNSIPSTMFADGGNIEIKHPGRLTALKERTGKTEAELWAEGNPDVRKMITFARNARKWKHADGGYLDNGDALFALGGDLQTHGADWTTGLTRIDQGGSHEDNPYDGVQVGVDSEGTPNLVEENETIFNDYVYSTRIMADDNTKKKFHLPRKKEISFADISKKLEREAAERPNDPISQAALRSKMESLAEEQERQKAEMEEQRAREYFDQLSPEEKQAAVEQIEAQRAAAQEQAIAEQQAMEEQAQEQGMQMSPEEAAMMQEQMAQGQMTPEEEYADQMAYGGNLYDEGGALKWLTKKYPKMAYANRVALARLMVAKGAKASNPENADHYYSTYFGRLKPTINFSKGNIKKYYTELVNAGVSRDLAFGLVYPKERNSEGREALRRELYGITSTSQKQSATSTAARPATNTSSQKGVVSTLLNSAVSQVQQQAAKAQQQASKNSGYDTRVRASDGRILYKDPIEGKWYLSKTAVDNKVKNYNARVAAYRKQQQSAASQPIVEAANNAAMAQVPVTTTPQYTTSSVGESVSTPASTVNQQTVVPAGTVSSTPTAVVPPDPNAFRNGLLNSLGIYTANDWYNWANKNKISGREDWSESATPFDNITWKDVVADEAFRTAIQKDNPALADVIGRGYDWGAYVPSASNKATIQSINTGNWEHTDGRGWLDSEDLAFKQATAGMSREQIEALTTEQLAEKMRNTEAYKNTSKWLEDENNALLYFNTLLKDLKTPEVAKKYARQFVGDDGKWKKGVTYSYERMFGSNGKGVRETNPGTYWHSVEEANRGKNVKNLVINEDGTIGEIFGDIPTDWIKDNTYTWSTDKADNTYTYYRKKALEASKTEEEKKKEAEGKKAEEEYTLEPILDPNEKYRKIGLLGPAVGLGMMAAGIGKPKMDGIDAALAIGNNGAALANYQPIGNYLKYTPLDVWANQNRMTANARAADRAIQNNAGPLGTQIAGIVANNYADQMGSGQLFRQAQEYDDALRKQVADFNRGTDQFNAEAFNRVSATNAELLNRDRQFRAGLQMQAANAKMAADADWYNSLYGNVAAGFKGLSDLGREAAQHNMIAKMAADTLFGNITDKQHIGQGVVRKVPKATKVTASKGGKLKRKRGGFTI